MISELQHRGAYLKQLYKPLRRSAQDGVRLKIPASEFGRHLAFLGLSDSFCVEVDNSSQLSVRMTAVKAGKWADSTGGTSKEAPPTHEIEKSIGRASAQSILYGKCTMAQLRPLYKKLYAVHYSAKLSMREIQISRW